MSSRIPNTRLLLVGSLVLAALAGCHKSGDPDDEDEGASKLVASVTVTKVVRADITYTLAVTGTIAALPNEDAKVSSPVPGRIAKVLVAEGDHVSAGQAMAQVDPQTFRDQVKQADGAVEQAKANLQNANANRDRMENLFQRGIAAGKEVEDARTQVRVNEGALNQAEAALSIARQQLARTEIRAPFDAIVVKRFVGVGEQVDGTAAQPVIEVANVKMVELQGNVPAVYLPKVHSGQKFTVASDAVPGVTFDASVAAVSPAVDPASDVGLVRIRILNPQGLLRLGMFLTAPLPLETHRNTLVVPPQAIYRGEDASPQIYRVEQEKPEKADAKSGAKSEEKSAGKAEPSSGMVAKIMPVTLGIETPDKVELLSGPSEGDTIILDGGYGLPDGAKLKVKQ
jgi:membrane fusion protein (multidrug efflux system)